MRTVVRNIVLRDAMEQKSVKHQKISSLQGRKQFGEREKIYSFGITVYNYQNGDVTF